MLTGVVPTEPPEKLKTSVVAGEVRETVYDVLLNDLSCRAWISVDFIDSMIRLIAVMPLSAASMVLMPFDMASSRAFRSLARLRRPEAVKKLMSRAELTFLPVARRCWLVLIRFAVPCRASR